MRALAKFAREVAQAPHYRRRPIATLRYAYAKWLFHRFRQNDPLRFLRDIGIDPVTALDGFDRWRPQLEDTVSAVQKAHAGQGGIGFDDGIILYGLARALRPDSVIETGVAAGVSTSFFAAALVENNRGRLFSVEFPPDAPSASAFADADANRNPLDDGSFYSWRESGVGWAIPAELRQALGDRHRLILQDARTALPQLLAALPYVDVFFHDDLHTPDHMLWEYESVWPRLRPGGVLISDDVNHGWIQFCRRQGVRSAAFNNLDRLCALRKPGREEARA
jgi:predicted O-methyltransferase YrrM